MANVKLSTLKPHPDNPRNINKFDFEQLVQDIKACPEGLALQPIIYDTEESRQVIAGSQRLRALKKLGYKEVPEEWVRCAADLSPEQQRKFMIISNTHRGTWNYDMLANQWDQEELMAWGVSLPEFGEPKDRKLRGKPEVTGTAFKIECRLPNQEAQQQLFKELSERGILCRLIIQ